jgi:hypothetical protein
MMAMQSENAVREAPATVVTGKFPKGHQISTTPELTPEEQGLTLAMIDELYSAGFRYSDISFLMGYTSEYSASNVRGRGGKTSRERFGKLTSAVADFREGSLTPAGYRGEQDQKKQSVEDRAVAKPSAAKPAPRPAPTPVQTSVTSQGPDFSWMDSCHDRLMEVALAVMEEGERVPEAFRGPYVALREDVERLMQRFTR